MIQLIASDIDGTLLQNGEKRISERFFRAANRLMERGVAVCAASGRQYQSLRALFAPVADRMYFICENGAVVYGPGQQLLSKTVIDRELSLALCRDILAVPECELLISGTNISYLCPKSDSYVDLVRDFLGNVYQLIPNPEAVPEEIVKISAYYLQGAAKAEAILKPRWQNDFQVAVAGPAWLDFTQSDKATGIRAICQALQIPREQTMAFGDNYNDIPMLNAVGHPYIMASAVPDLRSRFSASCIRVEDVLERI